MQLLCARRVCATSAGDAMLTSHSNSLPNLIALQEVLYRGCTHRQQTHPHTATAVSDQQQSACPWSPVRCRAAMQHHHSGWEASPLGYTTASRFCRWPASWETCWMWAAAGLGCCWGCSAAALPDIGPAPQQSVQHQAPATRSNRRLQTVMGVGATSAFCVLALVGPIRGFNPACHSNGLPPSSTPRSATANFVLPKGCGLCSNPAGFPEQFVDQRFLHLCNKQHLGGEQAKKDQLPDLRPAWKRRQLLSGLLERSNHLGSIPRYTVVACSTTPDQSTAASSGHSTAQHALSRKQDRQDRGGERCGEERAWAGSAARVRARRCGAGKQYLAWAAATLSAVRRPCAG